MTTTHNIPDVLPLSIQLDAVNAFMLASRTVFIIFLPLSVAVGILSLFIKVLFLTRSVLRLFKDVGLAGASSPKVDVSDTNGGYNTGSGDQSIISPTPKGFAFRDQSLYRDGKQKLYL
jgi:hypothetical protein